MSYNLANVSQLEESNKENERKDSNNVLTSSIGGGGSATSLSILPGTDKSHRLVLSAAGSNILNCEQDKENTPAESFARSSQGVRFPLSIFIHVYEWSVNEIIEFMDFYTFHKFE